MKKNLTIIYHLIFWIIVCYAFTHYSFLRPFTVGAQYKELLCVLFIAIMVYLNYFYFIPKFFQYGKLKLFWILATVTILLVTVGEFFLVKPNINKCISKSLPEDIIDNYFRSIFFLITFRNFCFFMFFFLQKIYSDMVEKYLHEKQLISKKTSSIFIVSPKSENIIEINISDLVYISQEKHITSFHLNNGTTIEQISSLSKVELTLPENTYLRINKNQTIIVSQIFDYDDHTLIMNLKQNNERIKLFLSQKYYDDFLYTYKNNLPKLAKNNEINKHSYNQHNSENDKRVKVKYKMEDIDNLPLRKTAKEILLFINNNPGCKIKDINTEVHWTKKTIQYNINNLKRYNLIKYVGDLQNGGYYAITQVNNDNLE